MDQRTCTICQSEEVASAVDEEANAVRAKDFAVIFYGCGVVDPRDSQMESLTAAVIDIHHQKNDNHDRDWWFIT